MQGESIESVSLEDETHQYVVDNSVDIDADKCVAVAKLPIIEENPEEILVPNGEDCMRVFRTVENS